MITTTLCFCVLLAPQQAGGDAEATKKAIFQVLTDQVDAWNRGDLKGFMAGYHHSGDITFYSGGTIHKGWDNVMDRYQKKYQGEGKEMGKLAFRDVIIDVIGQDTAVVRGRFELKTTKDMPTGLFTLIVRKTPPGWRIVHDHTSN
jgi:ketosteroid isomerase-like protein